MNSIKATLAPFILMFLFAFSTFAQEERIVRIETSLGDITVKLYNETPLHRDNFIKLAEDHFFDSLLFHRVINEFMIQGGDPDSRNAAQGAMLGNGGPGYQIPAEINPKLFHKKGVIAAAREGDQVNPERKSSGSQFYIVQGRVFNDSILSLMELKLNERKKQEVVKAFISKPENKSCRDSIIAAQMAKNQVAFRRAIEQAEVAAKSEIDKIEPFKFTEEQRKAYTTVGGTPHLDGAYTVFGEVIEGLDVVDKIAAVETDDNDRPIRDVMMKIVVVK